ncbi:SdpI family protein [Butyrivibrio sp.]|jgi:uncharacterized membrane protein|uniref:SdpI family protein n=1 Tax=Butyrivibrio sp. TaxID=28121 RepID=UPI001EBBD8B0|nr:SdpI family protein [Butyrivibrio sp.]MBE5839403.1 DUF1648 domain-containing protein [Butyrivibrio sp.]MBE5841345.1 DUF1648 domain-containing protein [Butyrivibrio sp.]
MLKENKRTLIIASVITILPIIIGIFLWNSLPDVMATHFGADNEGNGFSSKAFAVIGIPMLLLAVEWIGALVTAHDPRKQNISPKMFSIMLWIVPVISIVATATMYSYNLGYKMNITFFAELVMGLAFVVLGNYLPKARQNYTIGIKTPWTLSNEDIWNRTHRLAGYLWVVGGITIVVFSLIGFTKVYLMIAIIAVMAVIPYIYSYSLQVKHHNLQS